MNELDFTIELNAENLHENTEAALFAEADERLRKLADDHGDLTGTAITIRHSGVAMFEATVVVYGRPENVAATEKDSDPTIALKGALKAVERQVRQRREKLRKTWEQPGNHPVEQEVMEVMLAEEETLEE